MPDPAPHPPEPVPPAPPAPPPAPAPPPRAPAAPPPRAPAAPPPAPAPRPPAPRTAPPAASGGGQARGSIPGRQARFAQAATKAGRGREERQRRAEHRPAAGPATRRADARLAGRGLRGERRPRAPGPQRRRGGAGEAQGPDRRAE